MKSFEELGLKPSLLTAINELGFEYPMPVQEAVIPVLLEGGSDVVALAQTGTGKTAAFGLPLLHNLDVDDKRTQVLVLCPTRELCLQIAEDLGDYSKFMDKVHILPVYGGTDIRKQVSNLKKGAQVIVATPGRLIDLMNHGHIDLSSVHSVVMDEADEMLNMGFSEDIDRILDSVPEERNTLLFSATMPDEIAKISKQYMKDPKEIVIGNRNESTASVRHIYYMVHSKDKYQTLKRIVDYYPRIYGIIFCRTKADTQELSDKLIKDGYNVDALHGDLSQAQRDYVMQRFRLHNIQLLVATDVAARGIDVDDITHVINYTLPDETEVYTHRSGRTGRAGKTGISIAIINMREQKRIQAIEKIISKTFEAGKIPTGEEICNKQIFNLIDQIERVEVNDEDIAALLPSVYRKLEWLDKEDLVKRIVALEFNRLLGYYKENEDFETVQGKNGKQDRKVEVTTEEGFTKIFVNLGKMDEISPKNLLSIINSVVKGKVEVGRIDLFTRYSLLDVVNDSAKQVIEELNTLKYKGRAIKSHVATEEQINRGTKAKEEEASAKSEKRGGKPQRERRGDRRKDDRHDKKDGKKGKKLSKWIKNY